MDDRTRAKEQQSLEESVSDHVEHAHPIGADAASDKHVSKLRHSGIGKNLFDVRLAECDERGK